MKSKFIFIFLFLSIRIFGQDFTMPEQKPFFTDPVWQGAADPCMIWNPFAEKFYIWYTQRRANLENNKGSEWAHGTQIGIASSKDGKEWSYEGVISGEGLDDVVKNGFSLWAPHVIYHKKELHLFVTYVPQIVADWSGKRFIKHYTSKDGHHWIYKSTAKLSSENCIDPCVYRLKKKWYMIYKDEGNKHYTWIAESKNLDDWKVLGQIIDDMHHEAPYFWEQDGHKMIIVDAWDNGLRVYESKNGIKNWTFKTAFKGGHPGIFQHNGKSYMVYHAHFDPSNGKRSGICMHEIDINTIISQK
jgi:predicted GH43/DUF377 family glycosyl hydrolase